MDCRVPTQPNPMTGRRTPAEQKVYEASLVDLELWYAHQMTTVIILSTSVPLNQPGYASHGWQLFENGVARLLKTYRSDLWPPVIDVGDRLRTRHPPLSMDDFSLGLSASFLSLETDRPIVLRLYEHALLTAYGHAQALAFNKCRWGDVELRKLVCALPLCSRLRSLTLMDNVYGGKGLVTLCGAFVADAGRGAAVLPVLRDLNLSYNNLNDEEVSEGGAHPLQVLAWALSPVTASDVAAAEVKAATIWSAAVHRHELLSRVRPAGLPLLQTLTLENCRIDAKSFLLFCRVCGRVLNSEPRSIWLECVPALLWVVASWLPFCFPAPYLSARPYLLWGSSHATTHPGSDAQLARQRREARYRRQ
jgi:hypothetical protein